MSSKCFQHGFNLQRLTKHVLQCLSSETNLFPLLSFPPPPPTYSTSSFPAGTTSSFTAAAAHCAALSAAAAAAHPPSNALSAADQGRTLVHFSAQLKCLSWDRGCV